LTTQRMPFNLSAELVAGLRKQSVRACLQCGVTEAQSLELTGRGLQTHRVKSGEVTEDIVMCHDCHFRQHNDPEVDRARYQTVLASTRNWLESLGVDLTHGDFRETARRVATYYLGHFKSPDSVEYELEQLRQAKFSTGYSGMVAVSGIQADGLCPHHLLPVRYTIKVGYLPYEGRAIGLSKLPRVVELCASIPRLQEDITMWIAEEVSLAAETPHVAVQIVGKHSCMEIRGVRQRKSDTTTTVLLGHFLEETNSHREFLALTD